MEWSYLKRCRDARPRTNYMLVGIMELVRSIIRNISIRILHLGRRGSNPPSGRGGFRISAWITMVFPPTNGTSRSQATPLTGSEISGFQGLCYMSTFLTLRRKSESRERFNAKTLGDWISRYISEDRAITELNEEYSERYYKYRGQWLGKSSRI